MNVLGFVAREASQPATVSRTESHHNITRSIHGQKSANLKGQPTLPCWPIQALTSAYALTVVEKTVKDADSEAKTIDRNAFIDPVKHSGKVQICR